MAFSDKGLERKMLAALLEYEEIQPEYLPQLEPQDFDHRSHRELLIHYKKFYEDKELEPNTLFSQLGEEAKTTLSDVYQAAIPPNKVKTVFKNLKDLTAKRQIREVGQFTLDKLQESNESAVELLPRLEEKIKNVSDGIDNKRTLKPLAELRSDYTHYIDELWAEQQDGGVGIPTGLPNLDEMIGGWRPGQYVAVGGRPSVGKTDVGINFALSAARTGHNTAFFSLEMRREEVMGRLMGHIDQRNRTNVLMADFITKDKAREFQKRVPKLGDYPIYLDDQTTELNMIKMKVERMARKGEIEIAIIDYFGLIDLSYNPYNSKQTVLRKISKEIKKLAKRSGIPIILLGQLNRNVTRRQDNIPRMSDWRGTGGIEQDCDVGLLLHRDDLYDEHDKENINDPRDTISVLEIHLKKMRNGPVGKLETTYNRETGKIAGFGSQKDREKEMTKINAENRKDRKKARKEKERQSGGNHVPPK